MHSRHANTRRNTKRRSAEPWIGELIVVKEYDQMDSLREILELPARNHGAPTAIDETEAVERVADEHPPFEMSEENAINSESTNDAEHGAKRKREEEEEGYVEAVLPSMPNLKRRRVMSPGSLCDQQKSLPTSSDKSAKVLVAEKENIPPIEVSTYRPVVIDNVDT